MEVLLMDTSHKITESINSICENEMGWAGAGYDFKSHNQVLYN